MERLFLSIGAMKAGTTWLYSLLERHPQIQFTPEKEIHFLAANYINPAFLSDAHRQHRATTRLSRIDQLKPERQERIRRWYHDRYLNQPTSLEWYFNLFEPSARRRVWNADFSNLSALIDADGWKRLRADFNADVRAIYILREPCERLWSQFKFSRKLKPPLEHEDLAEQAKAFLQSQLVAQHSNYCRNLDAVRAGLGTNQVKAAIFDDIQNNPQQLLKSIEKFLDIPEKDYTLHPNLHQPINTTATTKPPSIFKHLCKPIVNRELDGLSKRGVAIPTRWLALAG